MKIESGRGVASAGSARRAGSAAAPGFAPSTDAPQRAAPSTGVQAVTPLDAILALQTEGGAGQRRARQARRGRDVLDALEDLVLGLAQGRTPEGLQSHLEGLRRGAEPSGDEGLDSILLEIDTRLAVEIAKLEMAAGRS